MLINSKKQSATKQLFAQSDQYPKQFIFHWCLLTKLWRLLYSVYYFTVWLMLARSLIWHVPWELGNQHYRNHTRRRRPVHTPTAKYRGRRRMRGGRPATEPARRRHNHRRRTLWRPTAAVGVRMAVGVYPSPLRATYGGLLSIPFEADGSRRRQGNRRRIIRLAYADGQAVGVCFLIFNNFVINIGCV